MTANSSLCTLCAFTVGALHLGRKLRREELDHLVCAFVSESRVAEAEGGEIDADVADLLRWSSRKDAGTALVVRALVAQTGE
jgi:hypothetical protein